MKSALLIIDMQNDFVLPSSSNSIKGAYEVLPALRSVLERFRELGSPVFHIVREYRSDGSDIERFRYKDFIEGNKYAVPGTVGCEVVNELKPVEGEYRIVKNRFSGFMNTELDFILRRLEVTDVIVAGIQYPNCIRATVFDAVAYGFNVSVLTDATSAKSEDIAKANIVDFMNIGIRCMKSSDLAI